LSAISIRTIIEDDVAGRDEMDRPFGGLDPFGWIASWIGLGETVYRRITRRPYDPRLIARNREIEEEKK
jgi:hypothetical protein